MSNPHLNDDRVHSSIRKRWPAIRARGFARFLWLRGVVLWGGLMFVLMAALTTYQLGTDNSRLPLVIGLAALLCAIGGAVWAALTWWINERIFRSLKNDEFP